MPENGYNGAYTGAQIDAAIAKAQKAITTDGGTIEGDLKIGSLDRPGKVTFLVDLGQISVDEGPVPSEIILSLITNFGPRTDSQSPPIYMYSPAFSFAEPIEITNGSQGCGLKLNGYTINRVGDPVYSMDGANKRYVDSKSPKFTTVTLAASGWSNNSQTVTVSGILADETAQLIQPMPAVASQASYMSAGIYCSGQAADSLTFTCSETPTEDIALYIVITEVGA